MAQARAEADTRIEPTPYQARVLAIPEDYDVFLGGARGGAKSYGIGLEVLRHSEKYGGNARVLIVRKDFPSLRDFEQELRGLFGAAYGKSLRFNAQDHQFRFPNGATVQLDQIESHADFQKYQGKSFSLICVDESGQYPVPDVLDMLRSCLRSKAGVPCRFVMAANPGGQGHAWLNHRHVAGVTPWQPYVEPRTGRTFVTCPSSWRDNPHLSADYGKQLEAATSHDEALRRAWVDGDWAIAKGSFFGQVLEAKRNAISPWPELPGKNAWEGLTPAQQRMRINTAEGRPPQIRWTFYVAGDHGSAAPAIFYLVARSPGAEGPDGRFYPAGSLVLFDEVGFYERDHLDRGLGHTVPQMAADVIERCDYWGMKPQGALDDACFAQHGHQQGTLADEYRKAGLRVSPAQKGGRLGGWQLMRRMMADAGKPDRPGFYISEDCAYFWNTVPFLGRDPKRPEDMDTTGPDHGADAARMACTFERPHITVKKLRGT